MSGPTKIEKQEFCNHIADRVKEFNSEAGCAMLIVTLCEDHSGYALGISAGGSTNSHVVMMRMLAQNLLEANEDPLVAKAGECIGQILDSVVAEKTGLELQELPEVKGHA